MKRVDRVGPPRRRAVPPLVAKGLAPALPPVLVFLLGVGLPALAADAPTSLASSAPSPAESVSAPASPDPRRIDSVWRELLERGRRKGGEAEKQEVERIGKAAEAPFVAALAEVFLEEWNFKSGDLRIENPRKVWSPPLPALGAERAASSRIRRRLGGSAEISPDGRVLGIRFEERSGDDELDFLVERWIRESRYRPAQSGARWIKAKTSWGVELR